MAIYVLPTAIYVFEVWILNDNDINEIEKFQHYCMCRRTQHFTQLSPTCSCFTVKDGLMYTNIWIKMLLFAFSTTCLKIEYWIKQLFKARAKMFNDNIPQGMVNNLRNFIYDILDISINVGAL